MEILTSPVGILKSSSSDLQFQVLNEHDFIAHPGISRKKRFLGDYNELLSVLEDYLYDEEDAMSSEEETNEEETSQENRIKSRQFDLCSNCTIIFNGVQSTNTSKSGILSQRPEVMAPTEKSVYSAAKLGNKNIKAIERPTTVKIPAVRKELAAEKETKTTTAVSAVTEEARGTTSVSATTEDPALEKSSSANEDKETTNVA